MLIASSAGTLCCGTASARSKRAGGRRDSEHIEVTKTESEMNVSKLFFALLMFAIIITVTFFTLYKFSGRFRELVKNFVRNFFGGEDGKEDGK